MGGLRKTRLKKNMDQLFGHALKKVAFWTLGYGNCRAVETVENELHVLHRSHRAWKTRQTALEFSTVPTASAAGYCYEEKDGKTVLEGLIQFEWTRCC